MIYSNVKIKKKREESVLKKIIENIEATLAANASKLGLVIVKSASAASEIEAAFGNKRSLTNKNLEKLTGIISEALVASGVEANCIHEMELKISFIADDDQKYTITLNLEGKQLKIKVEKS